MSGPSLNNNWPLPRPLPRREGRDHRATPTVLLFVACGVICSCVYHSTGYSVSYLRCIKILVNGVYSVILCLSVILSINIKNTTKYVLSVIICLYVIMSINIKAQSGPSPIPSPVGRGVITEIPLSACCSLFTVLVGLM